MLDPFCHLCDARMFCFYSSADSFCDLPLEIRLMKKTVIRGDNSPRMMRPFFYRYHIPIAFLTWLIVSLLTFSSFTINRHVYF